MPDGPPVAGAGCAYYMGVAVVFIIMICGVVTLALLGSWGVLWLWHALYG